MIGCTPLYTTPPSASKRPSSTKIDSWAGEYFDDMKASFHTQQGPRCADLLSCNVHSRRCLRRKVWPVLFQSRSKNVVIKLQKHILVPFLLDQLFRVASRSVTPLRAGLPRFRYSCPSQR